jgi:hypothetical protein
MISDDHYHIDIRLHSKFLPFSQVLPEGDNGENKQKNIIAYDGDGSIYRRHRPDVEDSCAVFDVWSYCYFLHYEPKL